MPAAGHGEALAGADYQNRDNDGRDLKDQDRSGSLIPTRAVESDLDYCSHHAAKVDVLSEDIEWNPGGFNTGFSPAAIRAFAQRNRLDAAALTPQIIWSQHRKLWNDFRGWQTLN